MRSGGWSERRAGTERPALRCEAQGALWPGSVVIDDVSRARVQRATAERRDRRAPSRRQVPHAAEAHARRAAWLAAADRRGPRPPGATAPAEQLRQRANATGRGAAADRRDEQAPARLCSAAWDDPAPLCN